MADGSDVMRIIMALKGQREVVSGAEAAAAALRKTGDAAEASGKQAAAAGDKTAASGKKTRSAAVGMLKWAAAAGIAYKAGQFLKDSVTETVNLGKATTALGRITGFDVKTGSTWLTMAKERGISTQQLSRSFLGLGRYMTAAQVPVATSIKKHKEHGKVITEVVRKLNPAQAMFRKFGFTQAELAKATPASAMGKIADAFKNMTNPAERAAYAQKLFGRSGATLLPLLVKGSKGLAEQQKHVQGLGGALDKGGVDSALKAAQAQRDLNTAMTGLKLTIGTTLVPAVSSLATALAGVLKTAQPLFALIRKYPKITLAFAAGIGVLVLALKAYTAYQNKNIVITKLVALAQWLWNTSLLGCPILLIVAGIALLVVGLIIAYKKIGWFRAAVDAAWAALKFLWSWVKANWPYLVAFIVSPIALAALLILKHWDQIKAGAAAALGWVKARFLGFMGWIAGLPGKFGSWGLNIGKALVTGIVNAVKSLPGALKSAIRGAVGSLGGKLAGVGKKVLGLQHGGQIASPGLAVVGERGPELVYMPARATVVPNQALRPATAAPVPAGATVGAQTIIVPVYLDRRQIAEAVATSSRERRARS